VFDLVSTDTRKVRPGSIFAALKGERFDAHDFLAQAIAGGAGALIISQPEAWTKLHGIQSSQTSELNIAIPVILVEDTLQALQHLAGYNRRKAGVPVVAVTGSNGKTSVKDMIAAVLEQKYRVLKTGGNFNNEIGLPLTLLELGPEHQAAIVEMGMRGRGEIQQLARIAQPDIGVISNIGEAHIELLGSMENIAQAKGELLAELPATGAAILNGDDPWLRKLGEGLDRQAIYYGFGENNHLQATDWQMTGPTNSEFKVKVSGHKPMSVQIPVPGRHNVLNALAAIGVGLELGLSQEEIGQGLTELSLSKMRLEIKTGKSWTVINDAYNANPSSMRAALEVLAGYPCQGKRIAVLGNMLELGEQAEKGHRSIGDTVASLGLDSLVTLGELAGWIAAQAATRGMKQRSIFACTEKEQAIRQLQAILQPGDVVLVKGSRGMKMEEIAASIE
jgi:UDP-N-acetylmuramoyl-tripeptide--D-alanyl-D-alanine ligase